ncbi:virulence RhuM family protein [Pedobacter aquatilis]|uniref:virulence RhuM family protein n=1 Tax=Pedobacter aquatilis TaxID=351343 RepID=UPI00292DE226|nr:RhuM family protein [Pedobacter aquatilis]
MDTTGQIFIYQTTEGDAAIDVKVESESIWLSQAQIVALFPSSKANISEHLRHIISTGELTEDSTVRKFRTVQREGSREIARERTHYNLDAIISVGYRVNSKRGTQFRYGRRRCLKST